MTKLVTTYAFARDNINRIWHSSESSLAETFPEKVFLSMLVFAALFSGRGLFTRWSIASIEATDFYHLALAIVLLIISLGDTFPAWAAFLVLTYILYEVIAWTLFDLFVLVRDPNVYGRRTSPRSFIWGAYCYLLVIWAYGIYYWSTGNIVHCAEKCTPLPTGISGVYFSAVTITTVGYGDYSPASDQQLLQLIIASEPFVGILLLGAYVALLVSVHAASVQKNFR